MQLIQVYVQKSTRTTLPLRSFIDNGLSVLSHFVIPTKSGAGVFVLNKSFGFSVEFVDWLPLIVLS